MPWLLGWKKDSVACTNLARLSSAFDPPSEETAPLELRVADRSADEAEGVGACEGVRLIGLSSNMEETIMVAMLTSFSAGLPMLTVAVAAE